MTKPMGRPRTTGDTFSFSDMAVVGGLSKSAIQHVAQARLLPRGEDDVCDIRSLKRVAVIGAFVSSGVPLMAAAQVAEAAHLEFGQEDGEVPSGLTNLWGSLPKDERASLLRRLPDSNDYWLHTALRSHPEIYSPGQALDSDAVYEIAEREFVYLRLLKSIGRAHDPFGPDRLSPPSGLTAVGRIEDWRRGGSPLFVHFGEHVHFFHDDGQPTTEAKALYEKMMAARENAVGVVVVNLSLAIRNGLDRLAEDRANAERKALR